MPAKAGIQTRPYMLRRWIPAFPGMTAKWVVQTLPA
jgi:hypothetical protein